MTAINVCGMIFPGRFGQQIERCRRSVGRHRLFRHLVWALQDDFAQTRGTSG